MDWRTFAACLDEDPELFFPVGTSGPEIREQVAVAKAVCARCDVRMTCLEYAMAQGEDDGIWGGLTPDERRSILTQPSQQRIRAVMRRQAAV